MITFARVCRRRRWYPVQFVGRHSAVARVGRDGLRGDPPDRGGFNFLAWLANAFALQSGSDAPVVPLLSTMPPLVVAITYGTRRDLPGRCEF